jgi:hypothetical protein
MQLQIQLTLPRHKLLCSCLGLLEEVVTGRELYFGDALEVLDSEKVFDVLKLGTTTAITVTEE